MRHDTASIPTRRASLDPRSLHRCCICYRSHVKHVPQTTAWKRRAKFAHALLVYHRRQAARQLRKYEQADGVPLDAATKRTARQYAGDVLGSPIYAPWLYVFAKLRGHFKEGWIPLDFFELIVIRHVNRSLRTLAHPKTFFRRVFPHDAIPDVAYVLRGVLHDVHFQPVEPAQALQTVFEGIDEVVIKDDGSGRGEAIKVMTTRDLDVEALVRDHPNAVVQRRIRDHPALRLFEDANGTRLRLMTTLTPGYRPEVRAGFVSFPKAGWAYSAAGFNALVVMDANHGTLVRSFGVPKPLHRDEVRIAGDSMVGAAFPAFEEAVRLVTSLHAEVPHLGVIGWDVMIDEEAQPWVIEWNVGVPGILQTEAITGPNFMNLGWHDLRWHPDLDG